MQSISDVCTADAACVLGVLYTTHHVPSTRSIWAFSTADTPRTRGINVGHEYRNTLSTSSIQKIEPKHVVHQVCTRSSIHFPKRYVVK